MVLCNLRNCYTLTLSNHQAYRLLQGAPFSQSIKWMHVMWLTSTFLKCTVHVRDQSSQPLCHPPLPLTSPQSYQSDSETRSLVQTLDLATLKNTDCFSCGNFSMLILVQKCMQCRGEAVLAKTTMLWSGSAVVWLSWIFLTSFLHNSSKLALTAWVFSYNIRIVFTDHLLQTESCKY